MSKRTVHRPQSRASVLRGTPKTPMRPAWSGCRKTMGNRESARVVLAVRGQDQEPAHALSPPHAALEGRRLPASRPSGCAPSRHAEPQRNVAHSPVGASQDGASRGVKDPRPTYARAKPANPDRCSSMTKLDRDAHDDEKLRRHMRPAKPSDDAYEAQPRRRRRPEAPPLIYSIQNSAKR